MTQGYDRRAVKLCQSGQPGTNRNMVAFVGVSHACVTLLRQLIAWTVSA